MLLTEIKVRRFRNIEQLAWKPAPGVNLICGGNGQGKTNLLEAMHMALLGRSFRARGHETCLPWSGPSNLSGGANRTGTADRGGPPDPDHPTLAEATIQRKHGERSLRIALGKTWKRVWLDGAPVRRLGELWGEAAVVCFTPEHVSLLKGPPGERRRWLDFELSLTSRAYLESLQRCNQALRELGALYRRYAGNPRQGQAAAAAYYPVLAEAGALMLYARARRLARGAEALNARFAELGGTGALTWQYENNVAPEHAEKFSVEALRAQFRAALEKTEAESWRRGRCLVGPHRDDFGVWLEGRDLRKFGSQGQHRLAALALQLESARRIEETQGEPPILLLDDFGSELDPARRRAVLESLRGRMQVFITATTPADFGDAKLFDAVREIKAGAWENESPRRH